MRNLSRSGANAGAGVVMLYHQLNQPSGTVLPLGLIRLACQFRRHHRLPSLAQDSNHHTAPLVRTMPRIPEPSNCSVHSTYHPLSALPLHIDTCFFSLSADSKHEGERKRACGRREVHTGGVSCSRCVCRIVARALVEQRNSKEAKVSTMSRRALARCG